MENLKMPSNRKQLIKYINSLIDKDDKYIESHISGMLIALDCMGYKIIYDESDLYVEGIEIKKKDK